MALSTSSSVNRGISSVSGFDFIVVSGVGTLCIVRILFSLISTLSSEFII